MHNDALVYEMKVLNRREVALAKTARQLAALAQRADEVDKHWGGRLIGFRRAMGGPEGILTMKGLYVSIYRFTSRAAHAQPDALDPYVEVMKYPWTVDRPARTTGSIFWPLGVPLFAHALLVCHEHLGWPDPKQVIAANDAMYVQEKSRASLRQE